MALAKPAAVMERYRMLEGGAPLSVTVALSGGADSMALLHILRELQPRYGYCLSAAHLNHMLRGAEADRDEAFVRKVCRELSVPLRTERIPVLERMEPGESIETAARRIRYAFLEEAAAELAGRAGCPDYRIATAHTASDQAETVLFRLVRGCGLKGAGGIPPVRGRIIRPLLGMTRAEVEELCRERNISFVTDSTNLTDDYARNRIRRRILPALQALNPAAVQALCRFGDVAREEDGFLDRLAARTLTEAGAPPLPGWDAARFLGIPQWDGKALLTAEPVLRRRMLRLICEERGITVQQRHMQILEGLLQKGSGREELPGGWLAELARGRLRLLESATFPTYCLDGTPLLQGKTVEFPGGSLRVLPQDDQKSLENAKINNLLFKNQLDCDKIKGKIILRSRQEGDRLHPVAAGDRHVGKPLRRWMQEAGVPYPLRNLPPVLADEAGVLWAGGWGADRRAAAGRQTRRILSLCWEPGLSASGAQKFICEKSE